MFKTKDIQISFLKSALTSENRFNSTESILNWIKERNNKVKVRIDKVSFSGLDDWILDGEKGCLRHSSNKFFSIIGINVQSNFNVHKEWDQPIISQPEIGYLGFITKEINGILYFLIQAKIEPGNVNHVQISPTVQATKSNYTQVHGGTKPKYLEYFTKVSNNNILLDQLQSEQGGRFYKKRNRNMIINVDEKIPVYEDFKWATLGQIKEIMAIDNIINMDTRTVISGISFGNFSHRTVIFYNLLNSDKNTIGKRFLESSITNDASLFTFQEIIHWITKIKVKYDVKIEKKSIFNLEDWIVDQNVIKHKENKYFNIIGVDVQIGNREVKSWGQPLIEPVSHGLCAFLVKEINGILHFLVQAKMESGNFDIIEIAPTVQCSKVDLSNRKDIPFLDTILDSPEDNVILDSLQSEEGGRFYKEQNRNKIVFADDNFALNNIPENYNWMTLNQLKRFIVFNNYVNIQARSLISAINYK
ncbi:hypothetical protein UJ101_00547 [Flavobacteriaceae bacterium UJ101]|nr:hypothetical protein UJ101_00547 [Flavobacteriaceae bacterium UJ101]